MTTLAQQLAAHPKWRWEPGMGILCLDGKTDTVVHADETHVNASATHGVWLRYQRERLNAGTREVPDIEHPATKGWLLAMLREATGDAQATTGKSAYFDTWAAFYGSGDMRADAYQTTEGAALASALLAVWGAADVDDMGTDADRKPRAF